MRYDAIIIGAGHNGLVTAAYLARAGWKVLVLERRDLIGGACVTEELWPGYKVSTAAYVVSLFLPRIIQELRLNDHGLQILPRNPSSFTPLPDGRSLILGQDAEADYRQIAQFSSRDAKAYGRYEAMLERIAVRIEPFLTTTPPQVIPRWTHGRRRPLWRRLGDLWHVGWMLRQLTSFGPDLPQATQLMTGAARAFLDEWFESDALKATLATDAVIGTFLPPSSPGTAYVLLHHVMGEASGRRGVWGYVQGGMGSLSQAIAAAARQHGAEIRCRAEVSRILVRDGRTVGAVLSDGTEIAARVIVSNADCHVTFERLLPPDELPPEFLQAVRRIDYASASMKINLALAELPDFRVIPGTEASPHHRGTIHIAPSLDYIEQAYDDAKYGRPSREPVLEITIPSVVDPSICPPGKHVMSIFVQYAPYRLAEGHWDDQKEAFADRCLEVLAQYAPNVPGAVIHRQVLSPADIEKTFALTGGNIFQGAMSLGQLFLFRPVPGWADYRTPIRGLYLCGAASHPGGGVIGACGYNAAREVLRDGLPR